MSSDNRKLAQPPAWNINALRSGRLVRYDDLVPCRNAFVDAYTPGSDQKENFTVIGPGVAEHPDQYVHISEPHGFNIGGARQPPGCTNSQHSHLTEEVFVVHMGRWAFRWGDRAQDGEAILESGDCISIPVNVFRGFENVGDDIGYLFAVLGRDDPGRVLWAPQVFDGASEHGLVLLENGRLVDTAKGEAIPDDVPLLPQTTPEQVAAHRRMTVDEMTGCIVRFDEPLNSAGSSLQAASTGITETPVIGMGNSAEGVSEAPLAWQHGFHLRRLDFAANASTPMHSRREPEVIFVHAGAVVLETADGLLHLNPGDTFTTPVGLEKRLASETGTTLFVVRGGDAPAALTLAEQAA